MLPLTLLLLSLLLCVVVAVESEVVEKANAAEVDAVQLHGGEAV